MNWTFLVVEKSAWPLVIILESLSVLLFVDHLSLSPWVVYTSFTNERAANLGNKKWERPDAAHLKLETVSNNLHYREERESNVLLLLINSWSKWKLISSWIINRDFWRGIYKDDSSQLLRWYTFFSIFLAALFCYRTVEHGNLHISHTETTHALPCNFALIYANDFMKITLSIFAKSMKKFFIYWQGNRNIWMHIRSLIYFKNLYWR